MSQKSYIVTLKQGADSSKIKDFVAESGGSVLYEYTLTNSLSVKLPEGPAGISALESQHSDNILDVEEDQEMKTCG
ncbi:HDL241Cp [Eremothecium sinecaudum]|uniref:HDL241Cp n=1 Tax=Eremothecium sinecaudum TaxID=45286 RepID=A0A109UYW8_9SACH|nr:HDL241Cp [Eremothecium sinecaudum]AMD20503.1 HDL241Cp [Eremothecium sinecaudum]